LNQVFRLACSLEANRTLRGDEVGTVWRCQPCVQSLPISRDYRQET
jgi:hypothetical protein